MSQREGLRAFPTPGWRAVHVGVEGDELAVAGLAIWQEGWRRAADEPPRLPHPRYPTQLHRFDVYEVGPDGRPIRFAAAEVSPGVWGFYLPAA